MKDTEIYVLIGKVLAGEANTQDHHLLQQWLKEDDEHQAIYENMQQIWHESTLHTQWSNADKVYQRILKKRDNIRENSLPPWKAMQQSEPSMAVVRPGYTKWKRLGIAASLLLLGICSLVWLQHYVIPTGQENATFVVKENPAGQKSKIQLTDGTIVWLNSDSKVRYPSNFNDSTRTVELTGEAYFQVAKDTNRPFVVVSGDLQTTAVGTAFNVQYYAGDSVAMVFLAEGRVKAMDIRNPDSIAFLEPGWGATIFKDSVGLQKFAGPADKYTSWKNGVLFFDNANIQQVVKACERWYNVEIRIKGTPPDGWRFTGKFKNENLENVLESMRYGKDFNYVIQSKHVELTF